MRRPRDVDVAEIVKTYVDSAVTSTEGHEEILPQPGDSGQIGYSECTADQVGEALLRFR